jgi:protocatechuate 3,4-dioxygenase beta subunit
MNRAVLVAAFCALVVLLACGAWLLWHDRAPSRVGGIARETAPETENGVHHANTPACAAVNNSPEPATNSESSPKPAANSPRDPVPDQPTPPEQTRPDFRRQLENPRPRYLETERKKFVSVTISGRVQDSNNAGVSGADIYVEVVVLRRIKGVPDAESSPLQKAAISGPGGAYSINIEREVFESATLTAYVSARARRYGPSPVIALDATAGGSLAADLTLHEGGSVRGRVVDTQGNPVSDVKVVLGKQVQMAQQPAHAGECFEALTDSSGAYAFEDVSVGTYPLGVLSYAHNYRSGPKGVDVTSQAAAVDDIIVEIVISIRIRVADSAGGKVQGVCTITFNDGKKVAQRLSAVVPEDGVVLLGYPPVGSFDVTVRVDGYFESAPMRLTFTVGQTTDGGSFALSKDPDFVKQH